MKRFNPYFLGMRTSAMIFRDAAGEGGSGGSTDEAAQKAAQEAAELKAAEEAETKAKAEAKAAEKAAESGDDDAKKDAEEKQALLREVMDKKNKLKEAQEDAAAARKKLAEFGDLDPETVKKLVQKEKDAEQAALEAKGEFDRVKEMMATEHSKEMEAKNAEIAALKEAASSKDATIDKLTIGRAFSDSNFLKNEIILSPTKMRALYGNQVSLQDGEVVVLDKPGGTAMVNSDGTHLSFDEGMRRLVDADPDKDTMMKSKMAPGGKSNSTTTKTKQITKSKDDVRGASRIVMSLNKDNLI